MPHRIGHLRDHPPEPFRGVLVLFPTAVYERMRDYLERGGVHAWSDEIDQLVTDALTAHLDRLEAQRA